MGLKKPCLQGRDPFADDDACEEASFDEPSLKLPGQNQMQSLGSLVKSCNNLNEFMNQMDEMTFSQKNFHHSQ